MPALNLTTAQSDAIRSGMRAVIVRCEEPFRKFDNKNLPDAHSDVYHVVCREANLYDRVGSAPIWLSRVVAGCLNDETERRHLPLG